MNIIILIFLCICVNTRAGSSSQTEKNDLPFEKNEEAGKTEEKKSVNENVSVGEIYENMPSAIISEIDKLAVEYSTYLKESTLFSTVILSVGSYLLFCGIMTKRISLAFIMSIFLFHYIEKIQDVDSFGFWPIPNIIKFIQGAIEKTNHPYITILIVSIVLSLIFTYLLGSIRILLALAATYFFYTTYIDTLISVNDEYQKYIFYASVLIIFLLIYFLFERLINLVFIALFSLTGSLLVFMTFEKVLNFDWKLSNILVTLKEDWEALMPSYLSAIFFILTLVGAFIQFSFIPSFKHF